MALSQPAMNKIDKNRYFIYQFLIYIYIYLFPITLSPILATVVNTLYLHLALFGFHHNRQRKGYQQRIQDL